MYYIVGAALLNTWGTARVDIEGTTLFYLRVQSYYYSWEKKRVQARVGYDYLRTVREVSVLQSTSSIMINDSSSCRTYTHSSPLSRCFYTQRRCEYYGQPVVIGVYPPPPPPIPALIFRRWWLIFPVAGRLSFCLLLGHLLLWYYYRTSAAVCTRECSCRTNSH